MPDPAMVQAALVIAAQAIGETVLEPVAEDAAARATAGALEALGASVERRGGAWVVQGFGVGGARAPASVLDLADATTAAALLTGVLASHRFTSLLTGAPVPRASSLQQLLEPLVRMGARFEARAGGHMPLAIIGSDGLVPGEHRMTSAASTLRHALLMAGLNTAGETIVIAPASGDEATQHLLRHFGAELRAGEADGGERRVAVVGWPELRGARVELPGDPALAAAAVVAAAIRPGSDVGLAAVALDRRRLDLFASLRALGADIAVVDRRPSAAGPIADLRIRGTALRGCSLVASDDLPLLAVAAACAAGTTYISAAARGTPSRPAQDLADRLAPLGLTAECDGEGLVVAGRGPVAVAGPVSRPDGRPVVADDDDLALAGLVMGLATKDGTEVAVDAPTARRLAGLPGLMAALGAPIETA